MQILLAGMPGNKMINHAICRPDKISLPFHCHIIYGKLRLPVVQRQHTIKTQQGQRGSPRPRPQFQHPHIGLQLALLQNFPQRQPQLIKIHQHIRQHIIIRPAMIIRGLAAATIVYAHLPDSFQAAAGKLTQIMVHPQIPADSLPHQLRQVNIPDAGNNRVFMQKPLQLAIAQLYRHKTPPFLAIDITHRFLQTVKAFMQRT